MKYTIIFFLILFGMIGIGFANLYVLQLVSLFALCWFSFDITDHFIKLYKNINITIRRVL